MAEIDDLSFEPDEVVAAEEQEDTLFENVSNVVTFVNERFKRAEDALYLIPISYSDSLFLFLIPIRHSFFASR